MHRLREFVQRERRGAHFAATMLMAPSAAVAITVLREFNLVAITPIWLIPGILVCGPLLTTAADAWWHRSPSTASLHVRIATQAIVVTGTIYATGWGPGLAIGLLLVGQETLAVVGSKAESAVVGWNLMCLASGELLIALGWAPSLIPVPDVHGLAVLMGIGIVFSYRSLRTALVENEEAAALTDRRERRFRALVQSSSDLVFVVDIHSEVSYASPSCSEVLGYQPELLLGADRATLVHPDDLDKLRASIATACQRESGTGEFSFRVLHRDGSWHWLEGLATNLVDDPAVQGLVINARDVTERRVRGDQQEAIVELGREVLRETSLESVFALATDVVRRAVRGGECSAVRIINGDDGAGSLCATAPESAESGDSNERLRVEIGNPDAPLAFIEVAAPRLSQSDRQFLEGVSGIVLSAIVRTRAEDAIRHQATHDPLTGLPNRVLFHDRLEHALTRRSRIGGYIAVMIVDLDAFKNVNDSLGHITGDALLVAVADRFQAELRGFDTIARLGGDEFAILVDDLDAPDQASQVAQRILDALMAPLELRDRTVAIGASVGVVLTDRPDVNADRLMSNADEAMYRAKREGKGCYRIFEAAMHVAAVDRMNLEQELRSALHLGKLAVHYQPIVDIVTGRVVTFEALARWPQTSIPPEVFIPVAEDTGLIVDLGRTVLIEACRQAKGWQLQDPTTAPRISVNASRLQLAHPGYVDQVADALARADLAPSNLVIEVTESVLVGEPGRIITTLDALRGTGVQIAIDDFGTGYSSLSALADLPIDILKIDKRFIDNLTRDDQGRGFVNAIMQLARTLHLQTVAEGVEHAAQATALIELGCTRIQGYLYSRPMPGSATGEYLCHMSESERGLTSAPDMAPELAQ